VTRVSTFIDSRNWHGFDFSLDDEQLKVKHVLIRSHPRNGPDIPIPPRLTLIFPEHRVSVEPPAVVTHQVTLLIMGTEKSWNRFEYHSRSSLLLANVLEIFFLEVRIRVIRILPKRQPDLTKQLKIDDWGQISLIYMHSSESSILDS